MIDSDDIHNPAATAPTDIDRLRRLARQRFIGAGVLVLVAVIGLPFLLDSKPRPIALNIAIQIDKNDKSDKAEKPPAPAASAAAPAPTTTPLATEPSAVPAPALAASSVTALAPAPLPAPAPVASAAEPEPKPTITNGYAIQAGSYTDANKLREVQAKLDKAGLKHYTQEAISQKGAHHTRVRLGPFATQQEANNVSVRVNKLGIKTIVIKPS